jgi:multiple sugar transport system permease protein
VLTDSTVGTPFATASVAARRRRSRGPGRVASRLLSLLVLCGAGLFFAVPVVWLLLAPTKTDYDMVAKMPFDFGSFAQIARTWDHLYSFESGVVLVWLRNSAIYCFSGTTLAVVVGIPAGYALAVTKFAGRRLLLTLTLVVMLVPANTLVLPLFLEMHDVHLLGEPLSVILPFAFFPFGVYLAYIYFGSSIPGELLAAARVDGCSEWKTFRYVALPLAVPVVALVAFFNFVTSWNNYYLPFVMFTRTNTLPASVGLALLTSLPVPEVALAILITISPVVVVFLFAQRALVKGLLSGSTNE